MELKLRKHDATRGSWWKAEGPWGLMDPLRDSVKKLDHAVDYAKDVVDQAVDVANYSMFIADVCDGLGKDNDD